MILSSSLREPIPSLVSSNVLRPALAGLLKSLVPEVAPGRSNGIAPRRIATARVAHLDARRAQDMDITEEEVVRQHTAAIPLGRYGRAQELARVAAFRLSPAASYVNGAILFVDGGLTRTLPSPRDSMA